MLWVYGSGIQVPGFEDLVWGLGSGVWGLGFQKRDLGLGIRGLGFLIGAWDSKAGARG